MSRLKEFLDNTLQSFLVLGLFILGVIVFLYLPAKLGMFAAEETYGLYTKEGLLVYLLVTSSVIILIGNAVWVLLKDISEGDLP